VAENPGMLIIFTFLSKIGGKYHRGAQYCVQVADNLKKINARVFANAFQILIGTFSTESVNLRTITNKILNISSKMRL
jgi:hypothetical protein